MRENEASSWLRLDPRTLVLTALYLGGFLVPAAVLTSMFLVRGGVGSRSIVLFVIGPAVLVWLGGVLVDLMRWRSIRFRVTTTHLERRWDLVVHTHGSTPRDRVRVVDVHAGLAYRLLGVAKLTVRTGRHDLWGEVTVVLDPLARDVAERWATELSHPPTSAARSAGPAETLLTFSRRWVRYAPWSVATPILGASVLGVVLQTADWFDRQAALVALVADLLDERPVLLVVALGLGAALVAGGLAATGLWCERWWSYRLTRAAGTLQVRRGLVSTRSLSVEQERLRGIELVEPFGARLLGAARLDVVAVGLRPEATGNRHHDLQTLVPAVPLATAQAAGSMILLQPTPPTTARLTPHPSAARRRRLIRGAAAVTALVLAVATLAHVLTDALLPAAGIVALVSGPVAVWWAFDAYDSLGHALAGEYLVRRRGSVRRSTVALHRDGVTGWRITSSPMQRRAGLVTLTACTAAGSGAYGIPDIGTDQGLVLADRTTPDVLSSFLVTGA